MIHRVKRSWLANKNSQYEMNFFLKKLVFNKRLFSKMTFLSTEQFFRDYFPSDVCKNENVILKTLFSLAFLKNMVKPQSQKTDSLETQAELAVLRFYVENQSILEPILLYRYQNVNKPKSRAACTASGLIFLPFYKIVVSFFSFLCQNATKARSNCTIIGGNLSEKHKVTRYKTQNGESNYVDQKFFCNFYWELPTCKKPLRQTSKYYRAGQLFGLCIV